MIIFGSDHHLLLVRFLVVDDADQALPADAAPHGGSTRLPLTTLLDLESVPRSRYRFLPPRSCPVGRPDLQDVAGARVLKSPR